VGHVGLNDATILGQGQVKVNF